MDKSYDELKGENIPDEVEEKIYKFNGDEIIKKYVRGKFLGKGGFAKCFELRCLNNKKLYAGKIVSKHTLNKSSAKQKVKLNIYFTINYFIVKIRNKNSQILIPFQYSKI